MPKQLVRAVNQVNVHGNFFLWKGYVYGVAANKGSRLPLIGLKPDSTSATMRDTSARPPRAWRQNPLAS